MRTVRVLSLFCGSAPERQAIIDNHKGKRVEFVGVTSDLRTVDEKRKVKLYTPIPIEAKGYSEVFHFEDLKVENAAKLQCQLKKLFNGTSFDEVHIYEPPPYITARLKPTHLRVLLGLLKVNGRIFHTFDGGNGLFKLYPKKSSADYESNLKRIVNTLERNVAPHNVSAKVERYALRTNTGWLTNSKSPDKMSDAIDRTIPKYSKFDRFARHAVVLKRVA